MSNEETKQKSKRGVGAAIDKAEAKARAKVVAAVNAWLPLSHARCALTPGTGSADSAFAKIGLDAGLEVFGPAARDTNMDGEA